MSHASDTMTRLSVVDYGSRCASNLTSTLSRRPLIIRVLEIVEGAELVIDTRNPTRRIIGTNIMQYGRGVRVGRGIEKNKNKSSSSISTCYVCVLLCTIRGPEFHLGEVICICKEV
jgi:hypothetical protein